MAINNQRYDELGRPVSSDPSTQPGWGLGYGAPVAVQRVARGAVYQPSPYTYSQAKDAVANPEGPAPAKSWWEMMHPPADPNNPNLATIIKNKVVPTATKIRDGIVDIYKGKDEAPEKTTLPPAPIAAAKADTAAAGNPYPAFTSNLHHNPQSVTDYNPYVQGYADQLGDATAGMEGRTAEQEARLTKAENSNVNDQLMQFGLGMLGKKDFYSAVGSSGQAALEKYTDNQEKHRKARDMIDARRDQIAAQERAQNAQNLGLATGRAGQEDAMNAANENARITVAMANMQNDTERFKVASAFDSAMAAAQATGDKELAKIVKDSLTYGVGEGDTNRSSAEMIEAARIYAQGAMTTEQFERFTAAGGFNMDDPLLETTPLVRQRGVGIPGF